MVAGITSDKYWAIAMWHWWIDVEFHRPISMTSHSYNLKGVVMAVRGGAYGDDDASGLMCMANTKTNTKQMRGVQGKCLLRPIDEKR
jgi:hypothetical protein